MSARKSTLVAFYCSHICGWITSLFLCCCCARVDIINDVAIVVLVRVLADVRVADVDSEYCGGVLAGAPVDVDVDDAVVVVFSRFLVGARVDV